MSNPRTAASPRGPSRIAHRAARRSRPAAAAYLTTPRLSPTIVRDPVAGGPASMASSRARRHPHASASGEVATAGRATAADRAGCRAPPPSGGDHSTAAAPEARPCAEPRDPPSNVTIGPGQALAAMWGGRRRKQG
eukprot:3350295-Alexandrium_andersonii.AAC.1